MVKINFNVTLSGDPHHLHPECPYSGAYIEQIFA